MKREEIDARLDTLKRHWEEGSSLPALFETVQWCQVCQVPLPEWAALATMNNIIELYNSRKGGTPTDYAHYLRWKAVHNQLWLHDLETLPSSRGRPRADSKVPTKKKILEDALAVLSLNQKRQRIARSSFGIDELEYSFNEVTRSFAAGEARYRFDDLWTFENP